MRAIAIATFAVVALLAAATAARAADAAAGEAVYKTQCGTCHSTIAGKNLVGPSLAGLVGRKAGDVAGFRYSAANKAADFAWDATTLDPYLINPKAVMPGTSMLYAGLANDQRRADLIAFLATLK